MDPQGDFMQRFSVDPGPPLVAQAARIPGAGESRLFRWQDSQNAVTFALGQLGTNPDQPVIVVAHSMGVDSEIELAHSLAGVGVKINLIVAIDPAQDDKPVPWNVEEAYGFYQTENWPGGHRLYTTSQNTVVRNQEIRGTRHADIDNDLANAKIVERIIRRVVAARLQKVLACGDRDFIGPCQSK